MDRLNGHRVDGLSTMLAAVNVRSAVYCLSDFAAPWGFGVENSPVAKFHVVLRGTAVLTLSGDPVEVARGELALLPHGDGHIMQDQPGSPVQLLDRILADHPVDSAGRLSYGGEGARTRLTRAAGYLSTTTKNVRYVARMVGYENEASFSKAFSRAFGCPPGAYRRDSFAAPTLGAESVAGAAPIPSASEVSR